MAQPNYRQLARQKAKKYGLDPNIFERQIRQESGFNPNALSPAGAIGIAQIMPATAKGWGVDPHNPSAALDAAARNMAQYVQQYGSYKNALVAYNAGPGRVGKSLPAETQNYIKTILGGSNPSSKPAGKLGTTSYAPASNAAPGNDLKKQIALSLLGFGNVGGGGLDPLSLAMAPTQKAPTSSLSPSLAPSHVQSGGTVKSGGQTSFDGKPVASWIAPILEKARKSGYWKGSVTSGIRTKSQQLAAAKHYGLQHYPNGPLASNHVEGNPGAVDVSDPQGLKRALRAIHNGRLKSAMPEDPVHFSGSGY